MGRGERVVLTSEDKAWQFLKVSRIVPSFVIFKLMGAHLWF